jgi:hypothetical protein
LLERAEISAVLRQPKPGARRTGVAAASKGPLASPLTKKSRVIAERESTPTAASPPAIVDTNQPSPLPTRSHASGQDVASPSSPSAAPRMPHSPMSLQAGKSDEERGETPSFVVKSLGRLAENTLLSAWITWQLTMAHSKGGANVVVWAALQRRIGSAFSRGETVVTLDKAMAQDLLEAFSKRVRDLTVEVVVIAFARLSDWVMLMLSLCLMSPLSFLP